MREQFLYKLHKKIGGGGFEFVNKAQKSLFFEQL